MSMFTHEVVQMDMDTLSSVTIPATKAPTDLEEGFHLDRGVLILVFERDESEV